MGQIGKISTTAKMKRGRATEESSVIRTIPMVNAGEEIMMEAVMVAVGVIAEEVKMANAREERMTEAVMVAVGLIAEEVIS